MKVALVCDFLTKMGGAQQTLLALAEAYPNAPIHCLIYDEKGTKGLFKNRKIIETSLKKMPHFIKMRPKLLLPFLAKAVEEFNMSEYDIVISSSDSYAHGVITKPSTFHACYCHTPMRYAWDWTNEYQKENNLNSGLKGIIVKLLLHKIRIWDRVAADRVDFFIANSENVKTRIKKYYRRDSFVIYPPVNIPKTAIPLKPEDYYLIVSRLEPYKKIDLAILACKKLNKKLKIVGIGSDAERLKSLGDKNTEFLGWQDNQSVQKLLQECSAFIFPGEDDFGIAPVEAMAAGRPVIAYGRGGVLETITEETGVFFTEPTSESLAKAIEKFETKKSEFKLENCRSRAEVFSKDKFIENIKNTIASEYQKYINALKK